jgi:hypothetical protein
MPARQLGCRSRPRGAGGFGECGTRGNRVSPVPSGRYWARTGETPERLGVTWSDFEPLLQGLLVDSEGRPISLSATAIQSALGRIRDTLAGSEALRELAWAVLRELVGR